MAFLKLIGWEVFVPWLQFLLPVPKVAREIEPGICHFDIKMCAVVTFCFTDRDHISTWDMKQLVEQLCLSLQDIPFVSTSQSHSRDAAPGCSALQCCSRFSPYLPLPLGRGRCRATIKGTDSPLCRLTNLYFQTICEETNWYFLPSSNVASFRSAPCPAHAVLRAACLFTKQERENLPENPKQTVPYIVHKRLLITEQTDPKLQGWSFSACMVCRSELTIRLFFKNH